MNEKENTCRSGHSCDAGVINGERINVQLRNHQEDRAEWEDNELAREFHAWVKRCIVEFKLLCSVPALRLDRLNVTCYGHFRPGRNGFGLLNEIAINMKHICDHQIDFEAVGTLLHELIHAEQQVRGAEGKANKRRNYHNRDFISRARSFGLIVDHRGRQRYEPPPTPFSEFLARYGIQFVPGLGGEPGEGEPRQLETGNSKLKPWICGCRPKPIHVQVAVKDFRARCLKCGQLFVRKG